MASSPDPDQLREAVRTFEEAFEHPDQLELYYSDYDGRVHINVECPRPPAGTQRSPLDRYRLESVELGETTTWLFEPVGRPTEPE